MPKPMMNRDIPPPLPPITHHPSFSSFGKSVSLDSSGSYGDFYDLPYYYDNIYNSDQAVKFLKSKNCKVGDFIIRKSSKGDGFLAITVVVPKKNFKHINIAIEDSDSGRLFHVVKENKFGTLDKLVSHYKMNPIKNQEKIDDVKLLYPIPNENKIYSRLQMLNNRLGDNSLECGCAPATIFAHSNSLHNVNNVFDHSDNTFCPENNWMFGDMSPSFLPSECTPQGLDSRPPAPLPSNIASSPSKLDVYYTYARNPYENNIEQLKMNLRLNEERCACGIRFSDSKMPGKITVHYSKYGKVFYQDSAGQTAWTLSDEIIKQMTEVHWERLAKIYNESGIPVWLLQKKQQYFP